MDSAHHRIRLQSTVKMVWPPRHSKQAETHQQITDNQGGSHKGRSAINLACKKVCTFELIRLLHSIAANVDIDALACFDMMIEACQNLSCLSHGETLITSDYMAKHTGTPSITPNTPSESPANTTNTRKTTPGTEQAKEWAMQ